MNPNSPVKSEGETDPGAILFPPIHAVPEPAHKPEKQKAFLIFKGDFELAYSFREAETRLEEIYNENPRKLQFVQVTLEEDGNPLGFSIEAVMHCIRPVDSLD